MVGCAWRRRVLLALLPFVAACGSAMKSQAPALKPASPTPSTSQSKPAATSSRQASTDSRPLLQAQTPAPLPVEDPIAALIAASDRHFKTGQSELEQGHFEGAKQEFN